MRDGGIHIEKTMRKNEISKIMLVVIKMGPLTFIWIPKDKYK